MTAGGRRTFFLVHETARRLAAEMLASLPHGWRVQFQPPPRTLPQNDLMWALLTDVSEQIEWEGRTRSTGNWKTLFTAALRSLEPVSGLVPGTIVYLGDSTSEMSKEEMSDLIELIYEFGAGRGVIFHANRDEMKKLAAARRARGGSAAGQPASADQGADRSAEPPRARRDIDADGDLDDKDIPL